MSGINRPKTSSADGICSKNSFKYSLSHENRQSSNVTNQTSEENLQQNNDNGDRNRSKALELMRLVEIRRLDNIYLKDVPNTNTSKNSR